MNQIKVNVEGYGSYSIDRESVSELISWLSSHEAVRINKEPIREVINGQFTGKELLNG